jgi:uncharacterized protein (DUF488 family)
MMKRTEIRRLIDVNAFFADIEQMTTNYQCTYLDALEEYARVHDLSLEFVANVVKTHKGKTKSNLTDECKTLNLVSE